MLLDLTNLTNAISALNKSINSYKVLSQNTSLTQDDMDTIKSGVIQNFEVAYEQCWKFIQRWIRENRTPEDADYPLTRKELFRLAAAYGLIHDPLPWFRYGEKRNLTSHIYDGTTAGDVFQTALCFLSDSQFLAKKLEDSND
jgi:nucleotidyltransferase substrate binding protein (TIGR01987 family)